MFASTHFEWDHVFQNEEVNEVLAGSKLVGRLRLHRRKWKGTPHVSVSIFQHERYRTSQCYRQGKMEVATTGPLLVSSSDVASRTNAPYLDINFQISVPSTLAKDFYWADDDSSSTFEIEVYYKIVVLDHKQKTLTRELLTIIPQPVPRPLNVRQARQDIFIYPVLRERLFSSNTKTTKATVNLQLPQSCVNLDTDPYVVFHLGYEPRDSSIEQPYQVKAEIVRLIKQPSGRREVSGAMQRAPQMFKVTDSIVCYGREFPFVHGMEQAPQCFEMYLERGGDNACSNEIPTYAGCVFCVVYQLRIQFYFKQHFKARDSVEVAIAVGRFH